MINKLYRLIDQDNDSIEDLIEFVQNWGISDKDNAEKIVRDAITNYYTYLTVKGYLKENKKGGN